MQRQQSRAPSRMPQKYFESQEVLPPTLLLSQLSGAAKGIILFVYLTASLSRLNRLTRVSPTRKQTRGNKLKQTDRRSTARWGWAGPYRPSSSTPACAGCPPPQAAHGLGHRHRAPTAPGASPCPTFQPYITSSGSGWGGCGEEPHPARTEREGYGGESRPIAGLGSGAGAPAGGQKWGRTPRLCLQSMLSGPQ